MDLNSRIRSTLKENYGDFVSDLEIEYENKVTEKLLNGDLKDREIWLTYNQVVLELKHNLRDTISTKELLYKLTDDDVEYSEVCVEKISSLIVKSEELERLYYKLKNL
jgi:hypothetical protein